MSVSMCERSVENEFQTEDGVVRPSIDKAAIERIFFFENIPNPAAEVERFCNNYEAQGWERKGQPITNVSALARNWRTSQQGRKFPNEFLVFWLEACRMCAEVDERYNEVGRVEIGGNVILLHLTSGLNDAIERNAETLKPIFERHFKGKRWKVSLTDIQVPF